MPFRSETEKIRDRFLKYVGGTVVDIGCGEVEKIVPHAIGIDVRKTDIVDVVVPGLERLSAELISQGQPDQWDTVFSSHCLEHLSDDLTALNDWCDMVKPGGHLLLYLPCDTKYDNASNPEHLQVYTLESFMKKTEHIFVYRAMNVIESGNDYREDCYSFYGVWQKPRPLT